MKKQKIASALGFYIASLFVGYHGPFAILKQDDHHPHTHKSHVVKLLKKEDDLDQLLKSAGYSPSRT